jgi:hypothetical protein
MSLQKAKAPESPENKNDLPALPTGIQGELEHPPDLSPVQWTKDVVEYHQLLAGWNFEGDEPKKAGKTAFELNQIGTVPRYMGIGEAGVSAELTYTERSTNYIRSGFQKETATASYAFVSASVEHSKKERTEETSEHKTLHITAYYDYRFVKLLFEKGNKDDQIKPTQDFLNAVDEALKADSKSIKYFKLCKVFKEYGQVFATGVTMGGRLFTSYKKEFESASQQHEEEQAVKAAVNVKVGKFAASAGFETGATEKQKEEAMKLAKTLSLDSIGGDPRHATELDKWISSLASHNCWSPISLGRVVPIYELLDEDRKKPIAEVIEYSNILEYPLLEDPPMRLKCFTKTGGSSPKPYLALEVPAGYKIISGGARVEFPGRAVNLLWASYPEIEKDGDTPTAWHAASVGDKPSTITISVIALHDPDDEWEVKCSRNKTAYPETRQKVIQECPENFYLTGGGAITHAEPHARALLVSSYPEKKDDEDRGKWVAESNVLLKNYAHHLTVYAIYIRPKSGRILKVDYPFYESMKERHPLVEAEPKGKPYVLVGGGAKASDPGNYLSESWPDVSEDNERWRAAGTDLFDQVDPLPFRIRGLEDPAPSKLTAYAISVEGGIFDQDLPGEATLTIER